eukprot:c45299_g1_i1 orf=137-361(+)
MGITYVTCWMVEVKSVVYACAHMLVKRLSCTDGTDAVLHKTCLSVDKLSTHGCMGFTLGGEAVNSTLDIVLLNN